MKYVVYFYLTAAMFAASIAISDLYFSITMIWLNVPLAYAMASSGKIIDPRVMIPAFFAMYHTYFAGVHLLGLFSPQFPTYAEEMQICLDYSLFGIIVFVNVCNVLLRNDRALLPERRTKSTLPEELFLLALAAFAVYSMAVFVASGASSKSEVNAEGGAVKFLADISMLALLTLVLIRSARARYSQILFDFRVLATILICAIYLGVTGERDIMFRFLFCLGIIYFDKKGTFSLLKLAAIVMAASVLVPLSQSFKAVLLGEFDGIYFTPESIFSNEFIAATRNLYALVYFGVDHSPYAIVNDILRAFVPNALIPGSTLESANRWFNSVYRVDNGIDGRAGWGFGLIAEGVLVGGYMGITLVMSLCAAVISFLYNIRTRSEYWYVLYLSGLTILIYSMRADIANFLSQTFKITGLVILAIFLINTVIAMIGRSKAMQGGSRRERRAARRAPSPAHA